MPEFKRHPRGSSRQIMSIDRVLGLTGDKVFLCLDRGFVEICKYLARSRGLWRTSYAYDGTVTDVGYEMPTSDEFTQIESIVGEGVIDMASCDDIVTALESLVATTASQNCGCGSNGGPEVSPDVLVDDTGDITSGTGTPPDGYATWAQYQQAKCDIARWILDNLRTDVQWMITHETAALVIGGLAAGLAGLLSANVLVAILGVLLVIAAYEYDMLSDLDDAIGNSYDDLLCALFTGTNAADSIAQFNAALETAINAETLDPVARLLLLELAKYWADTTSVNLMYAPLSEVPNIPSVGDCSACGVDCNTDWVLSGEYLGGGTFASALSGSDHVISVQFNASGPALDGTDDCGPMLQYNLLGLSGYTAKVSGLNSFRLWVDSDRAFTSTNATGYNSDTQPASSLDLCGRYFSIFSTTEFTMTIDKIGVC